MNTEKQIVKVTSLRNFDDIGFEADYFQSSIKGNYGIIILGGSEGGKPTHLANKIASLGYSVLSLAYFNEGEKINKELEMIPLEYFDAAKNWFLKRDEIKQDGLLIVGWSKGAELALVLASLDNSYKGVIGIAPSSVVWPGIIRDWSRPPLSSWSKDGKPLPATPYKTQSKPMQRITDLYKESLIDMTPPINHTIDYSKIKVPTLLFSGSLDIIWPADIMAEAICKEINEINKKKSLCTHFNYKNAGHLLDEKYNLGGTRENNNKANKDSLDKIKQFLNCINQNYLEIQKQKLTS
ncbi:acyl-CoA thioester hydrolase/BAAT C-terminal domain-containing protein [Aquimarina sp. RZ0]|uniref:acyl-CoA thioester hydrolase/BAAT C-terminal domain-containing protein n=1 Tax=Aquimarina sp. RZ0 TaxID=2607730 RepID=UPI0011F35711|nr:acyl-CoA thioester hydrolase/BAAT C-terminal domain-containing protein [Aquimarina sp. RZ0]KAA1243755.1 dienelactone hydrolase [Aquimarina sp. RZ0]